jgi:hypothetical protein
VLHPSGLPLACSPRVRRGPLGFTLGFGPRGYPRRPPGQGRALSTSSELHPQHQPTSSPMSSLVLCDLVSHRAPAASHATAPAAPPWTGEPPQPLTGTTTGRPTTACPRRRAPQPAESSAPLRTDPHLLVVTWLLVDKLYRRSCQDQLLRPAAIKRCLLIGLVIGLVVERAAHQATLDYSVSRSVWGSWLVGRLSGVST